MASRIWAGLDVGVETTSVCIINDVGDVLQQATCDSTLKCVNQEIRWLKKRRTARIGLEATGASLARGLRSLGYSVDMYETRQLSKFLRVRRNKTDAGDALGIAEAGRLGGSVVSKVYLKSLECQALQSRLIIRRHLIRQRLATVNLICRQIDLCGGRVRRSATFWRMREQIEAELKKLFSKSADPLRSELRGLLDHCERLITDQSDLDREIRLIAMQNETCTRFMQIPGVGPICALMFWAVIGDPQRFARSADVGSYLGLAPKIHQSGLTLRQGRISKMGNKLLRSLLVHSSTLFMIHSKPGCSLRDWAMRVEQRRGRGKARVALARKLATIMLAMWKSGDIYRPTQIDKAAAND